MLFAPAQRPAGPRFRFLRSFSALILREMTTTYGRSPGGYLWAILEPLAAMLLLSVVFDVIMRGPALGHNFMYFFASGVLPFQLYQTLTSTTGSSVRFSKPLLEYPGVTFLDALAARFVLNAMTELLIMVLIFAGLIEFYDLTPIMRWPAIFNAIAMAMALGFGVGVMNCYLITRFPLWQMAWAVLNRPLFFVSAVMFIPEHMPWIVRDFFLWNPLIHMIGELRRGLFATYDAAYVSPLFVYGLSLILSVMGLLLLRRYHKDILLK